jgi:hypothetical protein
MAGFVVRDLAEQFVVRGVVVAYMRDDGEVSSSYERHIWRGAYSGIVELESVFDDPKQVFVWNLWKQVFDCLFGLCIYRNLVLLFGGPIAIGILIDTFKEVIVL